MEIYRSFGNRVAIILAKFLHLKLRVKEIVLPNNDPRLPCPILYTVKPQVNFFSRWITIGAETCDYSDGDSRTYIKRRAIALCDQIAGDDSVE